MPEDRLSELRKQVDEINLQILQLLNERAELASQIGLVQQEMGTRFYDPEREAQMLTMLQQANNGPFSNEAIQHLFREIFRASMALEETEARAKILVQRHTPDEHTVITFDDGTQIGNSEFTIISGPCAIESVEQVDEVAAALSARGVRFLRGMGWKPRTSPYDFQGLGLEGLRIARQVANKYGMYIVSEIMDKSLIADMSEYTDIFWVGARNMSNSFLLKALGQVRQPVILKRSFGANDSGIPVRRRVHRQQRQSERHPDGTRHPHLRDLDAQHTRHQRGGPAQARIAPAGDRGYFALRRTA